MSSILDKIRAGAAIIDVRSSDEFSDGHYEGARNIPVNVLAGRLDEIGPKDRPTKGCTSSCTI
ncbi:MAG: rhodanese-like domain-containing protein, partial [Spirochaetota bacterium]